MVYWEFKPVQHQDINISWAQTTKDERGGKRRRGRCSRRWSKSNVFVRERVKKSLKCQVTRLHGETNHVFVSVCESTWLQYQTQKNISGVITCCFIVRCDNRNAPKFSIFFLFFCFGKQQNDFIIVRFTHQISNQGVIDKLELCPIFESVNV